MKPLLPAKGATAFHCCPTLQKNLNRHARVLLVSALALLFMVTGFQKSLGQTLYDSFTDGDFTASPVWGGNTSLWTVVANSDAAAGATGSNTVRLNATAVAQTDYLSSQVASWGTTQEWGFFIGRRAQGYTLANQGYFWLYANESALNNGTVDGYRIAIGDDTGGDEVRLEYIVNGAVSTTVITSAGSMTNTITDIGLLIRVTRSNTGTWTLFTSVLPTATGTGAIATDIPNAANTSVNQGTAVHNTLVPAANGYLGFAALHSTGANAIVSTEFDQIYFTLPCTPLTVTINNPSGNTVLTCTTTSIAVTASAPGAVSYAWSGGQTPGTAANTFVSPATYTVTATDANGCTGTNSIIITQNITPPTAGISNNSGGATELTCTLTTINVTATGGGTYVWSGGDATPNDATNALTAPGTYTVTVTAANGCTATASIVITQNITNPTAGITNNSGGATELTCTLTTINVTATGGGTYAWSGGDDTPTNATNALTAPGTYTVTVTSANGCTATASIIITQSIAPPPAPTCPANFAVCVNSAPFALTGGTPMGGVYTGTGVSGGTFTPTTAGVGMHTITYTITGANGCTNFCTFVITVNPQPNVICPAPLHVCLNAPAFTLTGATPAGGTYSGPGVNAGMFNPAAAGVGMHSIFYVYADPVTNCGNACSFTITVDPLPTPGCPASSSVCINVPAFALTGGTPVGGVYSGNGVSMGNFDPAVAGVGPSIITYTVTGANGCTNTCTFTITVTAAPAVPTCPANSSVCLDAPAFALTGGSPGGGTYSGAGVSMGNFDPAVAGTGPHLITYTVSNANMCSASCSFTITVTSSGTPPTCPDNFSVCSGDDPFALTGGSPGGGTYTGVGVDMGTFDPSSGNGPHLITYTVGDENGCTASCQFTITVNQTPPAPGCPETINVCSNDPAFALTGGSPDGGTYSGAGVSMGNFNPAAAGTGPHLITYTVTGAGGCTNTCTFTINVAASPVTPTCPPSIGVCLNTPTFALTGENPGGGTYTGTGVSGGMFNPAVAGLGDHIITYTLVLGNCTSSCTFLITVNQIPAAPICPEDFSVCSSDAPFTLSGATPGGGTYTGVGVTGNSFNPASGNGPHLITYTVSSMGCSNSCSFTINVNQSPATPTCPANSAVCIDAAPFALSGALPLNGTYSGMGVAGGMFNPAAAGLGAKLITYTVTDPSNGCTSTCSFTITVNPLPVVTCPADFSVGDDQAPFVLNGGSPAGGTYAGTGVSMGNFDPSVGPGDYDVTYSFTDPNGCSASCTFTITVFETECELVEGTFEWIPFPAGPQGTCVDLTDCCEEIFCYGLQYTPAHTGTLEDYTTGFFVPCVGGNSPVIYNNSCVMTDNSFEIPGCGEMPPLTLFNSSGNQGSVSVTACVPLIIHRACFLIPEGQSLVITEDIITDLTTNILLADNSLVTEFPDFTSTTITHPSTVEPLDDSASVTCDDLATTPVPPVVLDFCGNVVSVALVSTVDNPNPVTCTGTRTYTFLYTECNGSTFDYVFTYFINDNVAPVITCPADLTLECSEELIIPATPATATDNCNAVTVSYSDVVCENPVIGFTGPFDFDNWDVITSTYGGNVMLMGDEEVMLTSPDGQVGCIGGSYVGLEIVVPPGVSTIQFNWDYNTYDSFNNPVWDPFGYRLGATFVQLSVNGGPLHQSGTAYVNVTPGQTFAIEQHAVDCVLGSGITTAVEFFACEDVDPDESCSTAIIRTHTATDACGNSSACVQTILIQDTQAPVITCPLNFVLSCEDDSSVGNLLSATAVDACDPDVDITMSETSTQGTNAGLCSFYTYTITRVWTATDNCGNASTCTQTINVQDVTAPEITCPVDVTVNCDAALPTTAATATDNCNSPITYSYSDVVCHDPVVGFTGPFEFENWTATTPGGGTVTDMGDDEVMMTSPDQGCAGGNSTIFAITVAIATDITFQWNYHSYDVSNPGFDPFGYSINGVFTQLTANNGPIDQSGVTTVSLNPGQTFAFEQKATDCILGPGATSLINFLACQDIPEADVCTDLIIRTHTATDVCGNQSSCVQNITVVDLIAPTMTCPVNVTINCQASTAVANTGNATGTDNCDPNVTITFTDVSTQGASPAACDFYTYTITRTFVATDNCDNSTACVQTINVQDVTAPVIACPSNVTISCDDDSDLIVNGGFETMDFTGWTVVNSGDGGIAINDGSFVPPSGDGPFPPCEGIYGAITFQGGPGVHTIYQTVTIPASATSATLNWIDRIRNHNGSFSDPNQEFRVEIRHNVTNVLLATVFSTNPGDVALNPCISRSFDVSAFIGQTVRISFTEEDNLFFFEVHLDGVQLLIDGTDTGTPTATDNCQALVTDFDYTDVIIEGNCANNYTIQRIWTATDACGNTSAPCTQLINVQDIVGPVITCPNDTLVNCDQPTTPATLGTATATDNCSGDITFSFSDNIVTVPGACPQMYTIERTWTAFDECDNSTTCLQIIMVQDTTDPTITFCPFSVTVDCDDDHSVAALGNAMASDNCDTEVSITSSDISTQSPLLTLCSHYSYTITRTFVATDNCGNTTSCVQTITVVDVTAPVITCPDDLTLECTDAVPTTPATAVDACGSPITYSFSDVVCDNPLMGFTGPFQFGNWTQILNGGTITSMGIDEIMMTSPDDGSCIGLGASTLFQIVIPAGVYYIQFNWIYESHDVDGPGFDPFGYNLNGTFYQLTDNGGPDNQSGTVYLPVAPGNTFAFQQNSTDCILGDGATTLVEFNACQDQDPVDPDDLCASIILRTHTATDVCGNVSSCLQTILIHDTQAPSITCPANVTINCQDNTNATGVATATDACDPNLAITHTDASTQGQDPDECNYYTYVITRTWVATDNCGNSTACVQTINVQDVTAPVFTCPTNVTVECDASTNPAQTGSPNGVPHLYGTAYNGPSDLARFYEINPATGAATLIGTNTGFRRVGSMAKHPVTGVIYAVGARPSDNAPVLITINPATGVGTLVTVINGGAGHPFGTAYADISFRGSDNALYAYLEPADGLGVIDIVTGALTILGPTNTGCCGNGMTFLGSVLYHFNESFVQTLNQVNGNATNVVGMDYSAFPNNVQINRANSADVSPITGQVYVTVNGGPGFDNLGIVNLVTGVVTNLGTTTPNIDGLVWSNSGVTDNCTPEPIVSYTDATVAGDCPNEYTITRTWTAVDACDNSTTCSQIITVIDIDAPVTVSCPTTANLGLPLNVECVDDLPTAAQATTAYGAVNHNLYYVDACGALGTSSVTGPVLNSPNMGCSGTATYTIHQFDLCGNENSSCTFVINYFHVTPPSEVGGPVSTGSTVECVSNATPPTTLPVVQDVCGNVLTPTLVVPPASPVVLSYADRFVTYSNVSVNGGGTMATVAPGSSVNLAYNALVAFDFINGYCPGCVTQIYEGIGGTTGAPLDCHFVSNGTSWSHNAAFTAPTQPGVYYLTQNGSLDFFCYPSVTFANSASRAFAVIVVGPQPTYAGCEGTYPYIYHYEDCAGLTYDWTYTYTIDHVTPPHVVGMPSTGSTVECISNAVVPPAPVVADVCGVILAPISAPTIGGTYEGCEGTRTYTYNYVDCSGLPFSWTYTYTIDHVTPPSEFGGPVSTGSTVECVSNATPPTLPVVHDVCGNVLTPTQVVPLASPVVLTYADRFVTYSNVSVNGGGTMATVAPGASVSLFYNASVAFDYINGYCPGCVTQIYEGIGGTTGAPLDCHFVGNGSAWVHNASFTAPTQPGVYYLTQNGSLDYFCYPSVTFANNASRAFAVIVVGAPATYAGCEGTYPYVYHYEDCSGLTYDWTYTYTIDHVTPPSEFGGPVATTDDVECVEDAVPPTLPVVHDVCGNVVNPTGEPTIGGTYVDCEGTYTYTYHYFDCSGLPFNWTFTYTIEIVTPPHEVGGPVAIASTVECLADAVPPVLPVVEGACGGDGEQLNVLLLHSTDPSWATEVQGKLMATGNFASVGIYNVGTGTPTLAQLQAYDAVMLFSDFNFYNDADAFGDNLAAYVNGGGGVVSAVFATASIPVGGDFNGPDYLVMNPAGQTGGNATLGTVLLPGHPLMNGVSSFDGGSSSYRSTSNSLQPGGYRVADWSDGSFLITARDDAGAANDKRRVDLGFFPPSFDSRDDLWLTSTNGVEIMRNSLFYVANASYSNAAIPAPAPVIVDTPDPLTCEGTRTYTYTYEDCAGNEFVWTYTYTIDHVTPPVVPANGSSVIACGDNAIPANIPSIPVVTDVCGMTIVPGAPVETGTFDGCEGTRIYTYTYTDCSGLVSTWSHTFNVQHTPPVITGQAPPTSSTIDCYLEATAPALPTVVDACGDPVAPSVAVIGGTNNGTCGGTITYTYTYTDCAMEVLVWTYTYNVVCDPVQIHVWLEGAYSIANNNMQNVMNVPLHTLPGQIPTNFFYNATPAGHPYQGPPYNYVMNTGTQFGDGGGMIPYPADVVDWVLVTIRKNGILPANNIWTCTGWVHTDGRVTFPESCPLPAFTVTDNYYFLVQHRNHLGVLSPAETDMPCGTAILEWDFRNSNSYQPTFRFGQKQVEPGVWAMYAANGEQISSIAAINSQDRTLWKTEQGIFQYRLGDYDLNSHVTSLDETLWKLNQNKTSGIIFY